MDASLFFKLGEFAPGIPDRSAKRRLPSIRQPETWDFVEQHHRAERARLHSDFRISDGGTAYSWAVKKGIPPPGKSHLAIRQPDHDPSYMPFEGSIPSGYGKGEVSVARAGSVRILNVGQDKINLALLDKRNPQEITMVQVPKYGPDHWLMINTSPTVSSRPDAGRGKQPFRKDSIESLGKYLGNRYVLSSKIDGGQVEINLGKKNTEVFSHHPSTSGELINYTYLVGADEIEPPDGFRDTKMRAEVFGVRDGKVLPLQQLAPLMNASTEKSLARMQDEGIDLFLAPFQILEHKGKPMEAAPYKDHIELLTQFVKSMPKNWVLPDIASSSAAKKRLVDSIQKGKNKLTREGVVVWPLDEAAATPVKMPFRPHVQVYIDEVFPMQSGNEVLPLAGGFSYSVEPGGPVVGRVGTGFNMKLRKEMWEERSSMKGKKVIISALGQFPDGAYRAPAFISFHL